MSSNTKTYLVTFFSEYYDLPGFEYFIKNDPQIEGYWNYIPLTYIIKTGLLASNLRPYMSRYFPAGGFIVVEINTANIDGMLPQQAWDWFYSKERPPAKQPKLPLTKLGEAYHR